MTEKITNNHKIRKKWTGFTIFSGVIWGFFFQLVLVNIPLLRQLDVTIIDYLIKLQSSKTTSEEIVLVEIQEKNLREWGVLEEANIYAKISENLLDSGAKVVVLNLLPNWLKLTDENNNPLKQLVIKYPQNIVLVTRVTSFSLNKRPELNKYNQLFPFDSETNPLTNPTDIQGFFEYDSTVENPLHLNHPARLFHLQSEFILADNFNQLEIFDSVALLTLKKYRPQTVAEKITNQSIYLNFYQHNFVTLTVEDLDNFIEQGYFKEKIAIVGFSDPSNPDSLAMLSPFGKITPAMELQAHQIANLLTDSHYSLFPLPLQVSIIICTIIILNFFTFYLIFNNDYILLKKVFILLALLLISLLIFIFFISIFNKIIPYSIIVFSWLLTSISTLISIKFTSQKILLKEQQYELMRLLSSEQEAILTQAQKLINRLASDLHDGPLQELKVVMDDLEILEMQNHDLELTSPLDKLEKLGINIRKILAEKDNLSLQITPELKMGLDYGIKSKLEELRNSQKLTLNLILNLKPLSEPLLNSLWLANREDIFLFFCEGINNVIKHAQPPSGNASYVQVNLFQKQDQCVLEIINDGQKINTDVKQRKNGGYGTKLMETIASELPFGDWQRSVSDDSVYVSLSWSMLKVFPGKTIKR